MSRCFPYPPPGYTLSRARKETLIESIKEKERKKKKMEMKVRNKRKERWNDWTEIRNDQKDNKYPSSDKSDAVKDHIRQKVLSESRDEILLNSHSSQEVVSEARHLSPKVGSESSHEISMSRRHMSQTVGSESRDEISMNGRHIIETLGSGSRYKISLKKRKTESEQFERSSLTEEHGQPDRLPVPSSSYDSTENSKKHSSAIERKGHPAIESSQYHGKSISTRVPSKTFHYLASGQQPSLISKQTDFPVQNKDDLHLSIRFKTCSAEQDLNCNNRVETCLVSGQNIEAVFREKTGSRSKSKGDSRQESELQYKDLLGNLSPPQLQDASLHSEDLDWLFQGRIQDEQADKRQRRGSKSLSCSLGPGLLSCAEYLGEIDAYALPYVVPY